MMKRKMVLSLVVCLAGSVLPAMATEPIKSGPQVGEKLGGPFQPLNVNGAYAGKKHCLYCENGMRPAIMIFIREPNPHSLMFLSLLDSVVAGLKHPVGAYVVFCTDDDTLPQRLEAWTKEIKLKNLVVAVYHCDGPKEYKIAKDAEVTALLYERVTVKANHAYRKGEFTDQSEVDILTEIHKLLAQD
jgi:hypothetical protein